MAGVVSILIMPLTLTKPIVNNFLEIFDNWLCQVQNKKNLPNFQEGWPAPAPPTALTIKVVN